MMMPFISLILSFNVFELFSYFDSKKSEANFCTGAMVVSANKELSKVPSKVPDKDVSPYSFNTVTLSIYKAYFSVIPN